MSCALVNAAWRHDEVGGTYTRPWTRMSPSETFHLLPRSPASTTPTTLTVHDQSQKFVEELECWGGQHHYLHNGLCVSARQGIGDDVGGAGLEFNAEIKPEQFACPLLLWNGRQSLIKQEFQAIMVRQCLTACTKPMSSRSYAASFVCWAAMARL
jgi:hypothetical protein